jgi:hypothetical protein
MTARAFAIVIGLSVLASLSLSPGSSAAAINEKLAGIWLIEKPVFAVRTAEGKLPPFKAEAAKVYEERIVARKHGDTSFDSATWCASLGIPRTMFVRSPFEIIVRPKQVAFLYEWNGWARVAYFSNQLPPEPRPPGPASLTKDSTSTYVVPGSMGAALARWDGDTLVIETGSLIDTTLLDSAGTPHSDALKVTERLRLLSNDVLENRIRIEDPDTFTQTWETRVTYRRQPAGTRIHEDVCLDRIRDGAPAIKE